MINILLVDDSETEIKILQHIFSLAPDINIIGCAKNGKEGIELAKSLKPDLITMDIQMPIMDGLEAIRTIMSQNPIPIIVISSKLMDEKSQMTFRALDAGALSVLEKPVDILSPKFKQVSKQIIQTVRTMSEIKVVKRRFHTHPKPIKNNVRLIKEIATPSRYEIVAIGTSVGGPQVLKTIFSQLPENFPIPIVVVQHMTPGFMSGFVKWLNDNTSLTVKEAENNEPLLEGTVYFAPDYYHLKIDRNNGKLVAKLQKSPPVSGFCPSATVLLDSVSKICKHNSIGIILTGMGQDGAQGLLAMKNAKAHTLIQDKKSAVVFGMAGVAQELGAADKVVELDKIAEYLNNITSK